jgi:hypothetical protein
MGYQENKTDKKCGWNGRGVKDLWVREYSTSVLCQHSNNGSVKAKNKTKTKQH